MAHWGSSTFSLCAATTENHLYFPSQERPDSQQGLRCLSFVKWQAKMNLISVDEKLFNGKVGVERQKHLIMHTLNLRWKGPHGSI